MVAGSGATLRICTIPLVSETAIPQQSAHCLLVVARQVATSANGTPFLSIRSNVRRKRCGVGVLLEVAHGLERLRNPTTQHVGHRLEPFGSADDKGPITEPLGAGAKGSEKGLDDPDSDHTCRYALPNESACRYPALSVSIWQLAGRDGSMLWARG
jgi:hypothetical protein